MGIPFSNAIIILSRRRGVVVGVQNMLQSQRTLIAPITYAYSKPNHHEAGHMGRRTTCLDV